MTELLNFALNTISINGGTQARTEINQSIVAEYAEALTNGATFPPVVVFEDGASIWLADGFHRFHAHAKAGIETIDCDVRTGTQREAVLYSLSANASHGLRRTNEDKRKAVNVLLNDAEWSVWSDREISRQCGVGAPFVGDLRKSMCNPITDAVRTVERNGKTYEQNTSNIGKTAPTPKPEKEVEIDYEADETPDFVQIASDLEKERDAALDLVKRFEGTDVQKAVNDFDGLANRLACETRDHNELKRKYKFQSDLLKEIRLAVGVESNFDIVAKVKKL
jgi:hypothetical protein